MQEQVNCVTPWSVSGNVDYMAQINKFGTNAIDGELIKRWENVTQTRAHVWLRRGIVFSHQDLDHILNCVEKGIPIFLYTGRGPSSESMHLGHLVPFKFTKYLQDALNCIVIIQMSDDEKFLFKNGSKPKDLKKYNSLCYKNARDIIACGFDIDKTFIFSNLERNTGDLYFNNILIAKATSMNSIKGTFGIGETVDQTILDIVKSKYIKEKNKSNPDPEKIRSFEKLIRNNDGNKESNSIGQCMWPVFQCGPAFATSFRDIFTKAIKHALVTKKNSIPDNVFVNMKKVLNELSSSGSCQRMCCLVPMAIDQAPYFRMARDVASILDHPKPSVIYSEFIPGLNLNNGKMSSSMNENTTLFLDMNNVQIKKTILRHAYSGGQDTLAKHREFGGNISIDVCYQYLTYFLEDDMQLQKIAMDYSNGDMSTSELKNITADIVTNEIIKHQNIKLTLTDEIVADYFNHTRILDIGGCYDRINIVNTDETDYTNYGINFDRTFGYIAKGNR